jgi:hypothetical protein
MGQILQGPAREDVAIFNCHSVYFTAIWYACILWPFGIFCGYLVYFFPFWYVVPRKIWQHSLIRTTLTALVPKAFYLCMCVRTFHLTLERFICRRRCSLSLKCVILSFIFQRRYSPRPTRGQILRNYSVCKLFVN